jgi:hypothetical protein
MEGMAYKSLLSIYLGRKNLKQPPKFLRVLRNDRQLLKCFRNSEEGLEWLRSSQFWKVP